MSSWSTVVLRWLFSSVSRMGFYDLRHPASLARVTVHVASPSKKLLLASVLVALYGAVLPWVYSTVGQPYARALSELSAIESR